MRHRSSLYNIYTVPLVPRAIPSQPSSALELVNEDIAAPTYRNRPSVKILHSRIYAPLLQSTLSEGELVDSSTSLLLSSTRTC